MIKAIKKSILFLSFCLSMTGCATHYGARPPLYQLEKNMSRAQVIEIMGDPKQSEFQQSKEALLYSWDNPIDGGIGAAEEYFIVLQDEKLVQYGILTLGVQKVFGLWKAIEEAPSKAFK